jgi:putative heme-binding domain-containing protein
MEEMQLQISNIFLIVFLSSGLHAQPDTAETGKDLFAGACGACHGPNGEGGHGPGLADGRRVRRLSDRQLFDTIRKGVPGTDMPPSTLPDEQIRRMAGFVRSLSQPAVASAVKGDAAAGREIFFKKGGCASCHMIRGEGGFPGPDLSDIGGVRSLRQLREALLQPNARIPADFRAVTAVTRDGREIRGVAKSYTNYAVGILDAKGELHLLPAEDVKNITFHTQSLMPGDYARRLTPQEVENLLAFLSRQSMADRISP